MVFGQQNIDIGIALKSAGQSAKLTCIEPIPQQSKPMEAVL
jgi:hypothetical protein